MIRHRLLPPDGEVQAFWNEHERHIGTSLHGRRSDEASRASGAGS